MTSLRDHFLLAMPQLQDPHFQGSLTYMCEQGEQGALGIIVNKPMDLSFSELMEQMQLPGEFCKQAHQPIYRGGPVHTDRGFVLHTGKDDWKASLPVSDTLTLTTSVDILEALAADEGPEEFLIALGCAAWEEGQLENEIKENAWLTCPAKDSTLFDLPPDQRLDAAATSLGIRLDLMTSQVGHA
ncbi:YqgE/AlgH family protein [Marinospirillum perlucidum]|uniref:YqgE/AlgH family protein n=1 Tax=Marinospirillum perlucidum TaxID=1982602 RepID=UPI000DF41076|nr:YqgE/AlgH family protein [Marinospirillum perlucidum]